MLHVLFWLFNMGIFLVTSISLGESPTFAGLFLPFIVRWAVLIASIYISLYVLVPKYLIRRKYLPYALSTLTLLFIYLAVQGGWEFFYNAGFRKVRLSLWDVTYGNTVAFFIYTILTISLKFTLDWSAQHARAQQLETQNLQTELKLLKAHINPHFLFNSLNTIYAQIDKRNSAAREMVHQFAEMLRYQLYECDASVVPLGKEIDYLRNFISLQKLRKEKGIRIETNMPDVPNSVHIAPLLFLPFVENAFKFVGNDEHDENYILISLQYGDKICFKCSNTIEQHRTEVDFTSGGSGINNVQRRLELIYPGKHKLELASENNVYHIHLEIEL